MSTDEILATLLKADRAGAGRPNSSFLHELWRAAGTNDKRFDECVRFIADSNDQHEIGPERLQQAIERARMLPNTK